MTKALRRYLGTFAVLIGMAVIALATAVYILQHERFRFPFFSTTPFHLNAELSTAQAVTPGQGQTVRISGVRVGDISGVKLEDGHAVVSLDIDPQYAKIIRTDASALLRPKTGLKDMFLELDPGSDRSPRARSGFTIPVAATAPDVNPDQVLGMLDTDTRGYLQLLVDGAGQGLQGRGDDLREVYRRFEPTHRDLARVTTALAGRKDAVRHLVHSLRLLTTTLAGKDRQLTELVGASAQVFRSFASQDRNVSQSVALLPGALTQTTATLNRVRSFAAVAGPAAQNLRPAARELTPFTRALVPLAREGTPIVATKIRPFVRASRPVVHSLAPSLQDLARAAPDTTTSASVVNKLLNTLAYNPRGREGPDDANREEGFLFWLAWLNHDADAVFATADAHGSLRPIAEVSNCGSLSGFAQALGQGNPLVGIALHGLQGVFTDPRVCGNSKQNASFTKRVFGKAAQR